MFKTKSEETVYYASVHKPGFEEGLDRFADFFRGSPNFNATYVEKEVHAIESEHNKNRESPSWRVRQTMLSLANPHSVVTRFHTGNKETLYIVLSLQLNK